MGSRGRPAKLARQVGVLLVVVSVTIVFLVLSWRRLREPSREPTRTWIDSTVFAAAEYSARCGPGDEQPVLDIVVSPDKGDWIALAAETYMGSCEHTQVRVLRYTDLDAIRRIEAGEIEPELWLPSDTMFADVLDERWQLGAEEPLERGPSLLHSPLVLLTWSERLGAIEGLWPEALDAPELVSELICPGVALSEVEQPRIASTWAGWAERRGQAGAALPPALRPEALGPWGPVDVGYSEPTLESAGLTVLLAAAYGYLTRARGPVADAASFEDGLEHEVELEGWLHRCHEQGDNAAPIDSGHMARDLYLLGHEYGDGVLVYERAALELVAEDPRLRVAYPRRLYVADHPLVVFPGPWRAIAWRFGEFLVSEAMQREAFLLGFRPAQLDPSPAELASGLRASRLTRAIPHGVSLSLDELAVEQPPRVGRDAMFDLLHTWSLVTGTY